MRIQRLTKAPGLASVRAKADLQLQRKSTLEETAARAAQNPRALTGNHVIQLQPAWVAPDDGTYDIISPATEAVIGHAPEASVEQSREAARAAQEAFPAWSATKPEERAALLAKAADGLKQDMADPLPLEAAAPRTFGQVAASLRRAGRKPAARAYDAMIAATALANDLPLHTCNPSDFAGIDGLTVVAVPHPDHH